MYCAQFLVCLIAWFFGFWLCMCISQLALFFAMILRIPSYLFFAKFRWFSVSAFCRIIGGATSSFTTLVGPLYLFFFASHDYIAFISAAWYLLCCAGTLFCCFVAQFIVCFFAVQISCHTSICACSFCFFFDIIWQLCAIIFLLHYHSRPVHP